MPDAVGTFARIRVSYRPSVLTRTKPRRTKAGEGGEARRDAR
jgi:hypothetical protein